MNDESQGKSEHGTLALEDFPLRTFDKIRYADTDRQGHVNNAAFSMFLETGRVELLYSPEAPLASDNGAFVIVHLSLDFRGEITWPGRIDIGTRITSIGRSSIKIAQGLFQDDRCVATAETVIVQMDETTRRALPLSEATVEHLKRFM